MRPILARNAGFTLIELLIALVLSGLLAGSIFQLLFSQGQFARLMGAREEVQQNARASVELISSELRAATPRGILEANASLIRFLQPVAWGVLCDQRTAASTQVWVRFPTDVFGAGLGAASERWGVAVAQDPDPTLTPTEWVAVATPTVTNTGTPCTGAPSATNLGTGGAGTIDLGFTAAGMITAGRTLLPGSRVYVWQEVGYRVHDGMIQRLVGYDGNTPRWRDMAGPVAATDGLLFRYFRANEVDPLPTPVTVDLPQVARIRVVVGTQSTARFGSARQPQTQRDSTTVSLRNLN